MNKKIRFLERMIKEKEAYVYEYKMEIEGELKHIREQLRVSKEASSLANTMTTLMVEPPLSPIPSLALPPALSLAPSMEIQTLLLDIERKESLIKTTPEKYNDLKALND